MAKQKGIHGLNGTIDELTYYEAFGQLLVKRKGGLDPEKIKRNKERYQRRIQCAENFGKASTIVRLLYRQIPKENKHHGLFGKLTGMANQMLYKRLPEEEVVLKMKEFMEKEYGVKSGERRVESGVRELEAKSRERKNKKLVKEDRGIFGFIRKFARVVATKTQRQKNTKNGKGY